MPDFPLPIVGTKVVIRKLLKKDLGPFCTLEADKDVKRYVGGPVTTPRQEWIGEMRRLLEKPGAVLPLTVTIKATGRFAGRTKLSTVITKRPCFEIEILIAKKYWGQHLGRESVSLLMDIAFNLLKAESVVATVDPNNAASANYVMRLVLVLSIRSSPEDGTMGISCFSGNVEQRPPISPQPQTRSRIFQKRVMRQKSEMVAGRKTTLTRITIRRVVSRASFHPVAAPP